MTAAPPSGNGPGRDTQRTPNPPPCRVASCESPLQEFSGPRDRADAYTTLDALGLGDVTGRCQSAISCVRWFSTTNSCTLLPTCSSTGVAGAPSPGGRYFPSSTVFHESTATR